MTIDADRLAALRRAKLAALVRNDGFPDLAAEPEPFPSGAVLTDPDASITWVLVEEDALERLGAALARSIRAGSDRLRMLVEDAEDAAVLARRGSLVTGTDVSVRVIDGDRPHTVEPAEPAIDRTPAPSAELYRPVLADAGLEVVVEGGELRGELRGLEIARVEVDDSGRAHLEAGVGRFDREAGALLRAEMAELDALRTVHDLIAPLRRAEADPHPMNRLVRERWLRTVLVAHPDLVGARTLTAVGSAVPRRNLTAAGVATAVGIDTTGAPLVVTASVGVHLDTVPAAADDRLTHSPSARLLVVVPEQDAASITYELADQFDRVSVITAPDDWPRR